MEIFDVPEIVVINDKGIITASTNLDYIGMDMSEGEQSREFMCLIDGNETSYVQKLQPISYDASLLRKFAGVRFEDGGFVQVGLDPERFQEDLAEVMKDKTHYRHVGKEGFLMIADRNWELVSDPFLNYGEDRLLAILSADYGTGEEACRNICDAVKKDIDDFVADAPQFDDITMLCLYYPGRK